VNPPRLRVNPAGDGVGVLRDLAQPLLVGAAVRFRVEVVDGFPRVLREVLLGVPEPGEPRGALREGSLIARVQGGEPAAVLAPEHICLRTTLQVVSAASRVVRAAHCLNF
jgi:hypothetical protein